MNMRIDRSDMIALGVESIDFSPGISALPGTATTSHFAVDVLLRTDDHTAFVGAITGGADALAGSSAADLAIEEATRAAAFKAALHSLIQTELAAWASTRLAKIRASQAA
jgi:hypothetical protein